MARNSEEPSTGMAGPILTILMMMIGIVLALVVVSGASETAAVRIYVPEDLALASRANL